MLIVLAAVLMAMIEQHVHRAYVHGVLGAIPMRVYACSRWHRVKARGDLTWARGSHGAATWGVQSAGDRVLAGDGFGHSAPAS